MADHGFGVKLALVLVFGAALAGCGPRAEVPAQPGPEASHDQIGRLSITDAVVRPGRMGATTAAYLVLANRGATDDRLLGAESAIAARVEIHTHVKKPGGVLSMQRVDGAIAVPAQGQVAFSPGGLHVMAFGLNRAILAGETIPITLIFERAGPQEVLFTAGIPARPVEQQQPHSGH